MSNMNVTTKFHCTDGAVYLSSLAADKHQAQLDHMELVRTQLKEWHYLTLNKEQLIVLKVLLSVGTYNVRPKDSGSTFDSHIS